MFRWLEQGEEEGFLRGADANDPGGDAVDAGIEIIEADAGAAEEIAADQFPLKSLKGAMELSQLSARAVNSLGRHGISTREEARAKDVLNLLRGERNCGRKTLDEIERWMSQVEEGSEGGGVFALQETSSAISPHHPDGSHSHAWSDLLDGRNN